VSKFAERAAVNRKHKEKMERSKSIRTEVRYRYKERGGTGKEGYL